MVPLLSDALLQFGGSNAAAKLEALGVFGCEAARHLGALRGDGRLAPCSFGENGGEPSHASLRHPRGEDAWLNAFRAYHDGPSEPCRQCELFSVCRGGCQIASRYISGSFSPDPECPRVERAKAAHFRRSSQ